MSGATTPSGCLQRSLPAGSASTKYVGRGATAVPSMYGISSSIAASPDPAAASSSVASAKNGPTQNSAWNGPAALAFTDATRLYSACTLPRTSPAMRIFFAFGSDIAPYQTLRTPEGVIGED